MTIRKFSTWIATAGLAAFLLVGSTVGATDAVSARGPIPLPLLEARRPLPLPLLGRVLACPRNLPLFGFEVTSSQVSTQTAMTTVLAPAGQLNATGSGVTVAVIDGGWDTSHEYLDGYLVAEYDAIDDDYDADDLGNDTDDDSDGMEDEAVGHGTFVAGLIIAAAPDVNIMPIRALDDEGNGTPADIATAIQYAVDNGADVICLSAVVDTMPTGLEDAIDNAVDAEIAIVTAAGNDANGPTDHAHLVANAIVVGAVDDDDDVVSWSPSDADVHVYGPGGDTVIGPIGGDFADSYGYWDGTSFSAAFVAAAAAMVKELSPTITAADMKTDLMDATDSVTGSTPSTRGRINLETATE